MAISKEQVETWEMGLNTMRDVVTAPKTVLKEVILATVSRWVAEGGSMLNMDCLIGDDDSEVSFRDLVEELSLRK